MDGVRVESWPKCRSLGIVPEGTYKAFESDLYGIIRNIDDLRLLHKALKTIEKELKRSKSPKNIKKKLNKKFPEQKNLWKKVPTEDKLLALAIISTIAAIISAVIAIWNFAEKDEATIINHVHQYYYSQQSHVGQLAAPPNTPKTKCLPPAKLVDI